MSWLPPTRLETPASGSERPWTPDVLAGVTVDELVYLVVDEIVGAAVGLALSDWPRLDEQGRLRFHGRRALMLGCDRSALESFLSRHRLPQPLADRTLRIGDTFAVRVIAEVLSAVRGDLEAPTRMAPLLAPEDWIRPPVYDVTAAAREEAKVAFYAAVAPTLEPRQAEALEPLMEPPTET